MPLCVVILSCGDWLRCAWRAARQLFFSTGERLCAGRGTFQSFGGSYCGNAPECQLAFPSIQSIYIPHPNSSISTVTQAHKSSTAYNYYHYISDISNMQGSVPFEQAQDGLYKIASALDQTKVFTVNQTGALVLDTYRGDNSQKFNIFANKNRFALVCQDGSRAVMIDKDSPQDGAQIRADAAQFKSSFFEMLSVTSGPLAGRGFYLKTFTGKSIDVNEGRTSPGTAIVQWQYHGRTNQIWIVSPSSNQQPQQQQQYQPVQTISKNTFLEVPATFSPTNTTYKILSALNTSKALSVGNDRALRISDYNGDASQKFSIFQENGKFAFVVSSFQEGLCVFKDGQQNGAKIVSDNGKHPSSWFEVLRASAGEWQNKAYKIKTLSHRALDVAEGSTQNGTAVVQWSEHNDFNQVWLIVPADQAVPKYESQNNKNSLFGINLPGNLPFPQFPNLNLHKFG